eukprot:TRINITY_DN14754_c0_g1_i1.p1 TRINITY_DN14754_c0_g1~~TRINITY_DN14754_c0_g1_i1.p1  ORF type:complete len:145 (+),score=21.07 TRINITY_DN14754_c0_g1_i1:3-437(+)
MKSYTHSDEEDDEDSLKKKRQTQYFSMPNSARVPDSAPKQTSGSEDGQGWIARRRKSEIKTNPVTTVQLFKELSMKVLRVSRVEVLLLSADLTARDKDGWCHIHALASRKVFGINELKILMNYLNRGSPFYIILLVRIPKLARK